LSAVPFGTAANDLLQKTVGGLRDFDGRLAGKVEDWKIFVVHLASLGISPRGLRFFEIGTGWFPTLPLCFSLAGAASVETFDLERHLNPRLTRKLLARLESYLELIARAAGRPLDEVTSDYRRLTEAASLGELLERARIHYHAPADATRTPLEPASVDVVFSNSVFEHVPPDALLGMMRESRRVLREGGVTIHCANCGDHYAYFDRKITPINYLTYSERQWRRWNNSLQYQNRLRPSDFAALAERAGLEVVLYVYRPREDLKAALERLRVAEEFRKYPVEQLCSTSVAIAGRKGGARAPAEADQPVQTPANQVGEASR
jgi:hypothetical protein